MTSLPRCALCGHFHNHVVTPCDRKAQLFLLQTAFRVQHPDAEDRAADADLARFLAATRP